MALFGCFLRPVFTLLTQNNFSQIVSKEKILLRLAKKEPNFFAPGGKNSIFSSWTKVEMEKHYCIRLALMRFWDEGVPLHNIIPISLRPWSVIKLYLNLKTLNRLPTETSIKSKQIRNFTMRAYFHTAQFSGLKNKTEMSIGKNWPKETCHRHHWER